MPYLSEAWTFWPRQEAAGVADAMIKAQKLSIEVMAEEIAAARKQRKIRGSSFRTAGTTNVSASILSSTATSDWE
jgi:hypothetical protein